MITGLARGLGVVVFGARRRVLLTRYHRDLEVARRQRRAISRVVV